MKEKLGGKDEITAVVLGDDAAAFASTLYSYGAEKVIAAEHANLGQYSARPYAEVLTALSEKYKPSIFLFPASPSGEGPGTPGHVPAAHRTYGGCHRPGCG